MRVLKIILAMLVFLSVINICAAYSLESRVVRYNIVDNKIVVQNILNLSQKMTGTITFPITSDAAIVEAYLEGKKTDAKIQDNSLILDLATATKQIRLSYITEEFIEKSNFLLNMPIKFDTKYLKITLVLPEEAVLKKPITDTTGSIYPRPDKATTDGRSLIFIWERTDLKAGDEISIFAMYKTKTNYVPVVAVLIAAVLALLFYIFYYGKKPKKKLAAEKIKIQKKKKEPRILEHLKEDEQQIVRILKQRNGRCEQGTLRVITNFSKAHLSRLLMELEARKIIYKEKRGKKNLIFLK